MSSHPKLAELIQKVNKHDFQGRLLCVDPGETIGICIFDRSPTGDVELVYVDQIKGWPIENAIKNFQRLVDEFFVGAPHRHCICEAYNIYDWKLDQHSFSAVPTIQIIGCLQTVLYWKPIELSFQSAMIGKGFSTDQKLKFWDLYIEGKVHSRDAIRHGCHYLLFGNRDTQK